MRTVNLTPNTRTVIAQAGETGITVRMNALSWHTAYPAGIPELMVVAPGNVSYPVTVSYADGYISGAVPDVLLVKPGMYRYTFAWINAGDQEYSAQCGCVVLESANRNRWNPHSQAPDWADRIFLAAESIESKFDGIMDASVIAADAKDDAVSARSDAIDAKEAAEDAQEAAENAQAAAEAAEANARTHNYAITVSGNTLVFTPPVIDLEGR